MRLALIALITAAFCCWFSYTPSTGIPGDWRKWGFDSDPLAPEPEPVDELELV